MLKNARIRALCLVGGLVWTARLSGEALPAADPIGATEATITSDEMELQNNGSKTVFTGHVVLHRPPYVLTADTMTRLQETGLVAAEGHIVATWVKPTGEKAQATGAHARYNPHDQTTELWGNPRLTHWNSVLDPAPVVVTADRFIAYHDKNTLWGKNNVLIRQGKTFLAKSDLAKYSQDEQVIHLWGPHRADLRWTDPRGSGHFLSDRALLYLSPRRAHLEDRVTGHIIPGKS